MSRHVKTGQEQSLPGHETMKFHVIAAEQRAACLARANRLPELDHVLASVIGTPAESGVRHHLAAALARSGDTGAALEHVRQIIRLDAGNERARKLGYRIL